MSFVTSTESKIETKILWKPEVVLLTIGNLLNSPSSIPIFALISTKELISES